ncbi:MAG: hypothetical protein NTY65_09990 [Planctomycetota bacterium]|nr:hypothetical protein [Planctomycetota bacterium]
MEREYKIDASSRRCRTCGRVIEVNEEYYSAVAETAQENLLERHDFCGPCWKPPEGGYFSYWKARVPEPEPDTHRGPRLIDMGRLMQLFEHLADSEEVQARRFRYVLALVLMRKRRLRVVESRRLKDGGEELTLREVGTQRTHAVSAPPVTEDEIRSVADRLREVLDLPEKWDQAATAEEANAPANTQPESASEADSGN